MSLTEELEKLLELHANSVHADLAANSCQTDYDRRSADAAESAFELALENFEARLSQ